MNDSDLKWRSLGVVEERIRRLYETNRVVGRSGTVHRIHSAIDCAEVEFLARLIRDDPGIVHTLEIGCAYGLSSLAICSALAGRSGAKHVIIDPFQSTQWDGAGVKNLEEEGFDFFTLLESKSEFALSRCMEREEAKFDLVFVDGCHTFGHVMLDCFYATWLLRVGGYLVLDDVAVYPAVERAVDYLHECPCYAALAELREGGSRRSWRNRLLRGLLRPVPQKTWADVLAPSLYRRIFGEPIPSMVAFKKVLDDGHTRF